jgi:hypothetical protein
MSADHAYAHDPPDAGAELRLVPNEAFEESRRALAELVGLLGYPQEWADDLALQALDRGQLWRRVR